MTRAGNATLVLAHLMLLAAPAIHAQEGFRGWVGLHGSERHGWLENENRIGELCADAADLGACRAEMLAPAVDVYALHAEPNETSPHLGDLLVQATPGRGLTVQFRAAKSGTAVSFVPDVFLQDWGYGPYFHQTIVEQDGDWFQLPPDPWDAPVWLRRGSETSRPSIIYVQPQDIVEIQGKGFYVVAVEPDALLLRAEQPADLWCREGDPPPLIADEPTRYSRADLVDARGHLIMRPKYMKGC
ncbi:MAG: hypothetical protein GY937_06055 [bacterium]|nr:hypothetical protein [bacterium]